MDLVTVGSDLSLAEHDVVRRVALHPCHHFGRVLVLECMVRLQVMKNARIEAGLNGVGPLPLSRLAKRFDQAQRGSSMSQ